MTQKETDVHVRVIMILGPSGARFYFDKRISNNKKMKCVGTRQPPVDIEVF